MDEVMVEEKVNKRESLRPRGSIVESHIGSELAGNGRAESPEENPRKKRARLSKSSLKQSSATSVSSESNLEPESSNGSLASEPIQSEISEEDDKKRSRKLRSSFKISNASESFDLKTNSEPSDSIQTECSEQDAKNTGRTSQSSLRLSVSFSESSECNSNSDPQSSIGTSAIDSVQTDSSNKTKRSRGRPPQSSKTPISSGPSDALVENKSNNKVSKSKKNKKRKRGDSVYDEDYEIEAIVDHVKCFNGRMEYFVKWKGWDSTYNTWEPTSHLQHCHEAVANYFYDNFYKDARGNLELESSLYEKSLKQCTQQEMDDLCSFYLNETGDTIPDIDPAKVKADIEILAKTPIFARDDCFVKQVRTDLLLLKIKKKRVAQLKVLEAWEKELNQSSDSSKPIKVFNAVDLDSRPINFTYINKRIAGYGVKISVDPDFTAGCDCTDCLIKCSCKTAWGNSSFKYDGTLKVEKGTPIYECNGNCKCSSKCTNRVVQHGRQVSVAIFKTNNGRGWGLKTLEKIQKGQFVTEYVGEVILSSECDSRLKKYNQNKLSNYMFALDFNSRDTYPYTVDGTVMGNESHFINHSCKPNLNVFGVYIDCLDPDLPQLALFANRTIQPGEELTYDYFQDAGTTHSHASRSVDSSFFDVCRCGAQYCRKVVPS